MEDIQRIQDQIEEDFCNGILHLTDFTGVRKFKSIRRAIKKGHALINGTPAAKRPFNNRANTSKRKGKHSRAWTQEKKRTYEQLEY